jgi:hypothetical protein
MTQQRRDSHSTEFGIWLRQQDEIDSSKGYLATNLDYVWRNYKTGRWMLIEEKRHRADMKDWQRKTFKVLHDVAKNDTDYIGFFFIQFENTSPDDGRIWINYKEHTKQELIELLKFETTSAPLRALAK